MKVAEMYLGTRYLEVTGGPSSNGSSNGGSSGQSPSARQPSTQHLTAQPKHQGRKIRIRVQRASRGGPG